MKLYCVTIAYCPAQLLARSLILYKKHRSLEPHRHIVVQGHYPINQKKNDNDIKLIVEAFSDIELWDPGKNLGSAQSQNWALRQLPITDEDVFINLDPDSACPEKGWDWAMRRVLEEDPNCMLISCMAPMVKRYQKAPLQVKELVIPNKFVETTNDKCIFYNKTIKYGIPPIPTPFNLSMWRYSFIREIGGIPQGGLWWGETESLFYRACRQSEKYHAYLMDYMEDEFGKQMQDIQHANYKDCHLRIPPAGQDRFLGSYDEYLRYYYPQLIEIDTCRDLNDLNFP